MVTQEFNKEILDVNQNKEELLEQINHELERLKNKIINQSSGEYVLNIIGDFALTARKDNGFIPLTKEQRRELKKQNGKNPKQCKIVKDLDEIIEEDNGLMTEANYDRILRERRDELLKLDVWHKKCVMITLTTDSALNVDYDMMYKAVTIFSLRLYRLFGSIPSVKRYEYGGKTQMLHTHYLLFFDNEIPDILTKDWVAKAWKLGTDVDVTRFRKNSRALEYIAKFHYGDKDKNNKGYMMFKAGTHIIAIGKNIPRVQDTYRIKATEEDLYMLLDLVNKKSVLEYGETLFEYKQKNKFIDKNTGEEISFTGKQLFY